MFRELKTALVFSGGGARGAYQVGVWQALSDLRLDHKIHAVYGTSVGAINGAAFVQGDFELLRKIWSQLHYDKVFKRTLKTYGHSNQSKKYFRWVKDSLKERGLDVEPLKKILRSNLDEAKIRASKLDFGVVVFDLTQRRPIYLTKSQIPEGQLVEYVIASSTFPIFQPHRIDDHVYLDGGIYDNRPIGFIGLEDKIDSVLCVDVTIARHFWKNKKIKKPMTVNYIRPSRLLGSPMAFNNARILRNMELGYVDATKQLRHFMI